MEQSIAEVIDKLKSFVVGNKSYTHKLTFTMKKGITIFHMHLT